MSVARPAKEIAADTAANAASGTETGAGKAFRLDHCNLHAWALPEPFGSAICWGAPAAAPSIDAPSFGFGALRRGTPLPTVAPIGAKAISTPGAPACMRVLSGELRTALEPLHEDSIPSRACNQITDLPQRALLQALAENGQFCLPTG